MEVVSQIDLDQPILALCNGAGSFSNYDSAVGLPYLAV